MGMVVVILAEEPDGLSLGSETSACLIDLGVTYAAILKDPDGAAVVLEGRRFDPGVSTSSALHALGAGSPERRLVPIAQMTVRNEDP
jgi:hypothetical protein